MLYRSTLVSDARGSAGGITASRNRSGNYLRKRIKPTNALTSFRSRARNDLAGAASAWPTLTSAQRSAWNSFADTNLVPNKLGDLVKISGIDWFVRANSLQSLAGNALLTDPPTGTGTTLLTNATFTSLTVSTGDVVFTIDSTNDWANEDDGRLFVFATQPLSPGRNAPAGSFQYIGAVSGDSGTPPTSPQTLAMTATRTPVAGQVQFFRLIAIDGSGRQSVQQIARVVAVP